MNCMELRSEMGMRCIDAAHWIQVMQHWMLKELQLARVVHVGHLDKSE